MGRQTGAFKASEDTALAIRNAIMLGGSLLITWGVALVVRFYLPRHLGPDLFGVYNFTDNLAASCFLFLGLGLEMYIQKEIPVRPDHASDFFAGILLFRILASALVFGAMALMVWAGNRSGTAQKTVFIFGVAQLFFTTNSTLASLLHASRSVGRLSALNVATKLLWGAGVAAAVWFDRGLQGLAAAVVLSEGVRTVGLFHVVRKQLGLKLRLDLRATKKVLIASSPFYLNTVAIAIYARVDVNIMSFVTSDKEIGWYGSAANFAGLAMLMSPLVGWVLMPQLSRAAARSHEELIAILRRAIEAILALAIPISLMIGVGADIWVRLMFGPAFGPATPALRILAPIFMFTYLAMTASICLNLMNRAWRVTAISVSACVLNAGMNVILIPIAGKVFGDGGAGIGAASSVLLGEILVSVLLLRALGSNVFDKRNVSCLAKSLFACLVVIGVDIYFHRLGGLRLLIDVVVYTVVALGTGAVRLREVIALAKATASRRRGGVDKPAAADG